MRQILIVDDSPTIRRMVRTSLQTLPSPAEFVEAGSGLEAIERLALGTVVLMVLDLNMPDMHGFEVLGFIRGHSKYAQVPVIVLTTRGDESSRDAALRAGATAFMTKPFVPAALAAAVAGLLNASAASPAP
jgi:two-component system, chemotaxis family, chemotaxis protein CheY